MMLYHTRLDTDLIVQATRAKELLDFLTQSVPQDSNYGATLTSHNDYLSNELSWDPELNKSLLIHDHLSEYNDPVYFYRFAEHASSHGLQYLCDAEFHTDFLSGFQPENADILLKMSHDLVELEQYMDFIRNRRFRRTLLVHDNQKIDRQLNVERLFNLWIGSFTKPESATFDLVSNTPVKFEGHDGAVLTLSHPLSKAAMLVLAHRWPEYIPFHILIAEAQAVLAAHINQNSLPDGFLPPGKVTPEQVTLLAADLLKAYIYSDSLVEFHSYAPPFTMRLEERPLASAWARWESITSTRVTNLRHERVDLDIYEIHLLRLLDGTRDRAAIVAGLEGPVKAGEIVIREDNEPIHDLKYRMNVVNAVLDSKLQELARAALLISQ
jgi:methyltransferase-like protein